MLVVIAHCIGLIRCGLSVVGGGGASVGRHGGAICIFYLWVAAQETR